MSEDISRSDLAEKYFNEGANCSQAVLAAFADELGIEKDFAMRLASGFGGGVGRMREVCGAFSGLVLVENLKNGFSDSTDKETKNASFARIQQMAADFKELSGGNSIICRELLSGEKATAKDGQKKLSCAEIVRLAVEIAEKTSFFDKNFKKPLAK